MRPDREPVPNCQDRTPKQFGNGFRSVCAELAAKTGRKTGPKARSVRGPEALLRDLKWVPVLYNPVAFRFETRRCLGGLNEPGRPRTNKSGAPRTPSFCMRFEGVAAPTENSVREHRVFARTVPKPRANPFFWTTLLKPYESPVKTLSRTQNLNVADIWMALAVHWRG